MYAVDREKVKKIMLEKNLRVIDFIAGGISSRTITNVLRGRSIRGFQVVTINKLSNVLGVEAGSFADYK